MADETMEGVLGTSGGETWSVLRIARMTTVDMVLRRFDLLRDWNFGVDLGY